MHVILCYDVVSDRRRGRLFRKLKRYLLPVQKSVFEGAIPHSRLDAVTRIVDESIDHETDTVRLYLLCRGCRKSTRLIGTAKPYPEEGDPVVV